MTSQTGNANKKSMLYFLNFVCNALKCMNYVYNPLKYKKLYNKLNINFLLDKVCL